MAAVASINKLKQRGKILIIDDEPEIGWIFSKILGDEGYEITCVQTGKSGLAKLKDNLPDLVFLDLKLPDKDGIHILEEIKKARPGTIVIMITAHETIHTAVAAMKRGAYDYIPKPIPNERLKIIVDKALETQFLSRQLESLSEASAPINKIIGQSEVMQEFLRLIQTVAAHDISVVLRGESGTGKELAARAIHSLSIRKDNAFVAIDCATLPDTLVESELFGYEKGAFTGADTSKIGRFEAAEGGTVFLDEIGNLTTHMQVKLLRVLQERKIERLGGVRPIKVNVRIISATNGDLEEAMKKGEFREDLYHRLNEFTITLPSLWQRGDDVILLAQYFLDRFNNAMGKDVKGFSDEVKGLFKAYKWPGNVREMENVVRASVIFAKDRILPRNLPVYMNKYAETEASLRKADFEHMHPLRELKKNIGEAAEKRLIKETLDGTNWNKKKAAKILGIDYKTLFNKIKKYNLA